VRFGKQAAHSAELPLPVGERVGVRGSRNNEKPTSLTPSLSHWEREQAEQAANVSFLAKLGV
jgi:hypothetical protein